MLGGTVEKIGGGKFGNGAVTGAFQYLFNAASNKELRRKYERGNGGHHYFPFEEWPDDLSEAASKVFGAETTGPLKHYRTKAHIEYGKAVRTMFDSLGIDPAKMTEAEARAFISSVKSSKLPAISGYLASLKAPNSISPKLRMIVPLTVGVGLLPLALDPAYTWRNYAEDAACGVMFGCSDAK